MPALSKAQKEVPERKIARWVWQKQHNGVLPQLSNDGIKTVSIIGAIALLAAISSVAFEISIPTQRGSGRLIITHPCKCVMEYGQLFGFQMSGSVYVLFAIRRA